MGKITAYIKDFLSVFTKDTKVEVEKSPKELSVEVKSKTYYAVGDDVYITKESALPEWLKLQIADIALKKVNESASINETLELLLTNQEALAQSLTELTSTFNQNKASVEETLITLSDKQQSLAQSISNLETIAGTNSARISTVNQSISSLTTNVTNIQNTTIPALSGDLEDFKNGVKNGDDGYVYASANKVLVSEFEGKKVFTGWEVISGQHGGEVLSSVSFMANNFYIQNSDTLKIPFRIEDDEIYFNGRVSFRNVDGSEDFAKKDMSNVTVIDGGKIATNSLDASTIKVNTELTSPIIKGGYIEGVNIVGAVLKASWIDYTSTGSLTDWKEFTIDNIPTDYIGNFAHDNYGNLIVDSEGYVRLPGKYPFTIDNREIDNNVKTKIDNLFSYSSYMVNTTNRLRTLSSKLFIPLNSTLCFDTINSSGGWLETDGTTATGVTVECDIQFIKNDTLLFTCSKTATLFVRTDKITDTFISQITDPDNNPIGTIDFSIEGWISDIDDDGAYCMGCKGTVNIKYNSGYYFAPNLIGNDELYIKVNVKLIGLDEYGRKLHTKTPTVYSPYLQVQNQ